LIEPTSQPPGPAPSWRSLNREDVPLLLQIAKVAHPDLAERSEVFVEKWRLFPEGCFGADQHGDLRGYGIAHPWLLNEIPPLDAFLRALPDPATCLYVHDVALLPSARGHGLAGALIDLWVQVAQRRGLPALSLVSVYGTFKLWGGLGFRDASSAVPTSKLQSYGPTARYMIRPLGE
jgi:GNAT superfamily N-acetyltransferase